MYRLYTHKLVTKGGHQNMPAKYVQKWLCIFLLDSLIT